MHRDQTIREVATAVRSWKQEESFALASLDDVADRIATMAEADAATLPVPDAQAGMRAVLGAMTDPELEGGDILEAIKEKLSGLGFDLTMPEDEDDEGEEIAHDELAAGMWICRTVVLEKGGTREEVGLLALREDTQRLVLWSVDRYGLAPACLSTWPVPGRTYRRVGRGEGLDEKQTGLIEAYAERGVYDRNRGCWVLNSQVTAVESNDGRAMEAEGTGPDEV